MLEYDWFLTALIYGLIGCFRSKLSDLTCPITNKNLRSFVMPWWKTLQDLLRSLKILEDLQRSWKTRIFQGSLKDLAQILEDP